MVGLVGTLLVTPPAQAAMIRGHVDVAFTATSTLHDIDGRAPGVDVTLRPEADGRWGAEVRVPVASLDTGNGWRDAAMRTLLRADTHPDITAQLTAIDPETVRRDGTLPLALSIAGVTQATTARIGRWDQDDDTLTLHADLDVSLTAVGLAPPRTLFMRVGDVVHVRVDVRLRRE